MKKHLFTALSIILVVAMALTFVACDLSGSGNGGMVPAVVPTQAAARMKLRLKAKRFCLSICK